MTVNKYAFTSEFVEDRQPLQGGPVLRSSEREVPAPNMILPLGALKVTSVGGTSTRPRFSRDSSHFQSFLPTESIHPFPIHNPTFSPQHRRQTSISEPWSTTNHFAQSPTQFRLVATRASLITLRASRLLQHRARPSLRDPEFRFQIRGRRTPSRRG